VSESQRPLHTVTLVDHGGGTGLFLRVAKEACGESLMSYDVLEHIYDVEGFLTNAGELTDGPLTLFMSSEANIYNPRNVR